MNNSTKYNEDFKKSLVSSTKIEHFKLGSVKNTVFSDLPWASGILAQTLCDIGHLYFEFAVLFHLFTHFACIV